MSDAPDELFLIDGNSLVYRAFFALPEAIATSTGFPTNAIFGFASMLVKLLTDNGVKPTVVVWDRGSSGRKELYEDYKGHRPRKPDLLGQQYPHIQPLVEAFGYTNYGVEGYEADDVIATLTERAKALGIPVTVVTGDRDAFQLVGDGVRVMATARGITETKMYDADDVRERYGIGPELIPDFYGLKGDTSDNIPGVPGIGDKTASDLLQRFGTLEDVLASIEEISGAKRKQNLTEHAEDARMSKQLATAVRDVPIEADLDESVPSPPDRPRLRETFREFELREPLRRIEEALAEQDEAEVPRSKTEVTIDVRAVEVPASELERLDGELAALAAERPGAPEEEVEGEAVPSHLQALGFAAYAGGDEVLVGETETLAGLPPPGGDRPGGGPETRAALTLSGGGRRVVAHDWKTIATGEEPCDAPPLEHDTMVAAYLLARAGRAYPLLEIAEREGIGANVSDGDGFSGLAERAVLTRELAERQRVEIEEQGLTGLFRDVELPLVDVLVEMERTGVKLDTDRLATISEKVEQRVAELEREVWELAGEEFTIGSPQQLGEVLFEKLGLSRKRRGKTGYSTDPRVLQAIRSEHPIIEKVEQWREYSKLKSTYLDALPDLVDSESRLHTTFNQTATTTGRLSSTAPNLQNTPIRTELGREIRECFVAAEGCKLISADYSQVELRVLAHISGEQVLKDIFARGEDVHAATAGEMFGVAPDQIDPGLRSKAKMINFGIVYGLSAYGLADRLDIPQDEAQDFIDRYIGRFPKVKEFIDTTIEQAKETGYVTTLLGRKRRIPELRSSKWPTRSLGERLAVNTPIQGTSADIIKIAMVRARAALLDAGLRTRLVRQIHEELLFEAPEGEVDEATSIVVREMADAYPLDPPLGVDAGVGDNWLAAK